jgi:hypothetical protein
MSESAVSDKRDFARRLLAEIAERERALEDGLRGAERRLTRKLEEERAAWVTELKSRGAALSSEVLTSNETRRLGSILTAPVIYAMVIPIALLDLFFSVYQAICFPVYGVPRVSRQACIVIDRHHLGYLNGLEKLNCVYCGYANGVLAYAREIAARSEQYWCPIKHARVALGAHARYATFMEYGGGNFEDGRETLRRALADEGA